MTKLLGCPFCNSPVVDVIMHPDPFDYITVIIRTKCDCFKNPWMYSGKGEVEKEAIEIWEQRAESIYEYTRKRSIVLEVKQQGPIYLAWFNGLKDNGVLIYGHGSSRKEAINDFIDKISGLTLKHRGRKFKIPRLIKL